MMSGHRRCSPVVITATACLVLLAIVAGAEASAIRRVEAAAPQDAADHTSRYRRDVSSLLAASSDAVVREKRTLHKLKPLVVLPAKIALGTGAKLVAGAKLGAKAVGLGAKALGVGAVGLKAVKKVAKVTVKAATALGVKAVLINFLFQKVNQMIDFKTRLLSNLDQKNRQQNAQFLSPSKSVGNKDEFNGFPVAPPEAIVSSADGTGYTGVPPSQPQPSPTGFAPGSDLIASPPPSSMNFDQVITQNFADPQNFGERPKYVDRSDYNFAGPTGFAATNDDGSSSSVTSF